MQTDPLDHRKSPQRLPVNPRRNKVPPEQRKRVATACNSCNVRRTKCSGQSPCSQCIASSRECIYPVITPKVTISRTELEELRRRVEAYDKVLQDVVPDAEKRSELLHQLGRGRGSTPTTSPASQQQLLSSSPGRTEGTATTEEEQGSTLPVGSRLLHDSLGTARFQGETSEMALADNLKTLFRELGPSNDAGMLSSIGTCYTTDIKPAPFLEVDPLRLPPQSTISTILAVLRTFLQDGSNKPEGSLPSGGIFWWGDLRSVPAPPQVTGQVELDTRNARRLAFYNTALAVACQIVSTRPATQPDHSQVFFSRATLLMGNALDMSRCSVGGVSVLTLMAYYLLETDRREAAAHYVGLAVRMSMSLGLHRGCGDERGKRIFWTLYLMDRWLSYLLGRPANLPDEAIQLPLPAEAHAMPPVTGIRAHIELARISDHIVCNIYRVAPQRDSPDSYALNLERAAFMLDQWLSDLPPALQLGSGAASTDDPSVCMLHMYHNQLLVLAYRPCLLAAVRGAASQSPVSEVNAAHIEQCLRAAERNMGLARHVATLHQPRRLLHAGLHHVFSAALCFLLLEVYRVLGDGRLGGGAEDAARSSREIDFAIELFRREAHAGNAYGRACVRTLRELKAALGRVGRSRRGSMDMDVDQALQGLQRAASWQTHMSSEDGDGSSSSQQLQQQQQGRPVMGMLGEETLYSDVLSWMGEDWPAIE